jgi:hypothetical protein
VEQFVLFAIFLLVGALNLLIRWLRSRAEPPPKPPDARPRPGPEAPARDVPGLPPRIRLPAPPPAPPAPVRTQPAPVATLPARPRQIPHRLGGRRELRRAIVLMEILGPCRAAAG